jgi:uncharacterized protein YjbI with pentapeptide repeats
MRILSREGELLIELAGELKGRDLSGVRLEGADPGDCALSGSNLSGADKMREAVA